ncbi:glutathione S-transferase, partial [Lasiosphaeria hispida]
LNESRAQRIVWLLEELGLEYEVVVFYRDPDTRFAPPELAEIHALGKSPVVTLTFPPTTPGGKEKKTVLAESGFIAQYLTEHFGRDTHLAPPRYLPGQEGSLGGETEEWMRYQYFLHYAEGSLHPQMMTAYLLGLLKSQKIPLLFRLITSMVADKLTENYLLPNVTSHLAWLESQLTTSPGGGKYLTGEHLTAADILIGFSLQMARKRVAHLHVSKEKGKVADAYPRVWEYLDRLENEAGFKRAEEKVAAIEKKGAKSG